MHILCTNDDGVQDPGLLALVQALQPLGQVSVLAPDHNWSASGHVKTLHRPIRVKECSLADGTPALASDGAPSDCVAMAVLGMIAGPIDLVASGINPHANVGHDLTYSGTVTAAMEAVISGIPALAVSLDGPEDGRKPDFQAAGLTARRVAEMIGQHGLPSGILLNINVPDLPVAELKGFQITRQGQRVYRDKLVVHHDPRGRPYYWIGGESPTGIPDEGTDMGALAAGYVSVTPVHLDLTAYQVQETLAHWMWPAII